MDRNYGIGIEETEMIRVKPLAMHPEHVRTVAYLLHNEWGKLAAWSDPVGLEHSLQERCTALKAPIALVALNGDNVAGSVSLTRNELPHHPEWEFWVSDVIVAPDQRGRGIGRLMMNAIVSQATALGISDLYLYTPDQKIYYHNLGWSVIGMDNANGENNTVMHYAC